MRVVASRREFLDAAAAGDAAAVDAWLAQPDGDVNATTGERWTALMYAVARGHLATVERLLRAPKIDLNATSLVGSSALALALQHRNNRIAALLLQSGASRSTLSTPSTMLNAMLKTLKPPYATGNTATATRLTMRSSGGMSWSVSRMLSPDWSVVWSPAMHARFPPTERDKCRLVALANYAARRQLQEPSALAGVSSAWAPVRLFASLFGWRRVDRVRWTFLPPPLVLLIIEYAAFLW